MNCSDNNCSSCITDILEKILVLQKQDYECDNFVGCDKPFLGPINNKTCYNTRPIQLFICSTGTPWTFTYNNTDSSSILRIENLDDCCCTCRILYTDNNELIGTNEFVTIDLTCCGAIRCLDDTYIDLC